MFSHLCKIFLLQFFLLNTATSYAQFSKEDIKAVLFLNGKKQILEVHDDILASWKVNIDKAKASRYTDESQQYSRVGDVMRDMALLLEAYLNMEYMAVYSADKKVVDNVVNDWRDRIKTRITDNRSYYKEMKNGGISKEIRDKIEKDEQLLQRLEEALQENTPNPVLTVQ